jgi:hypothetical protein
MKDLATTINNFYVEKILKIRETMSACSYPNAMDSEDENRNILFDFEPTSAEYEISGIIKETEIEQ